MGELSVPPKNGNDRVLTYERWPFASCNSLLDILVEVGLGICLWNSHVGLAAAKVISTVLVYQRRG